VQLSDAADFLLSFSSGGSFDAAQFSNAGTMLAAFKRWQETVLQSLQDGNSVPRVVLVKPVKTGGLGNRMPSLVTGERHCLESCLMEQGRLLGSLVLLVEQTPQFARMQASSWQP
jgi:hypothetical protein